LARKRFEPFDPTADIILRGSGLSVYRARTPRTVDLVVVAPSRAVSAGGRSAREFPIAESKRVGYPFVPAPGSLGRPVDRAGTGRHRMRPGCSRGRGEATKAVRQAPAIDAVRAMPASIEPAKVE
jgi:hypothetical protein